MHAGMVGEIAEPHDLLELVDRPDRLDEQLLGASEEREQVDGLAYQARLFSIQINCDHVRLKILARSEDNRVIVTDPSVKPISK